MGARFLLGTWFLLLLAGGGELFGAVFYRLPCDFLQQREKEPGAGWVSWSGGLQSHPALQGFV